MARINEVRYVNFYTVGSAAYKVEPTQAQQTKKAQLPKPRKARKIRVYVDPMAVLGMTVAFVMLIMMISGTPLSFQNVAAVSVLGFFLSMGAPNQPGSVLVGLLMLMTFLNLDDLVPVAIYCEVVFGSLLNMINVLGDVVTVAILDKKGTTG